jgi:hypothetical protein
MSPFGGVRQNMSCIRAAESEQQPPLARRVFCAADLPFSFIGDVVTWPYTAAYSFINQPIPTPPVMQPAPPVLQASAPSPPQ